MRNLSFVIPTDAVHLIHTHQTRADIKADCDAIRLVLCTLFEIDESYFTNARRWSPSERRTLARAIRWIRKVGRVQSIFSEDLGNFFYMNFNTDHCVVLVPTDGYGDVHTARGPLGYTEIGPVRDQ